MIDHLLRPIGPGPRPPADGFATALAAGRRRRWRTVRTNAACATAAAAALVAATVPRLATPGLSGLQPTRPQPTAYVSPAPTPTPSPTATPPAPRPDDEPHGGTQGYAPPAGHAPAGPYASGPAGAADPAGQAGPDPASTAPPPGDDGPWPTASPEPTPDPTEHPPTEEPQPSPSPTPSPGPSPEPEPVERTVEDQPATDPCETSSWCLSAQARPQPDGSYALRLLACRGASDTVGELRYSFENEADFRVLRDGAEVWRWSDGQPDSAYSHQFTVDRWTCAVWTTLWWRNDSSGARVPAGTYRLEAFSTSTTLPDVWQARTFSVS